MIDIAKARALCEAAHALECSSFKLLDFAVAARDGWAEAIDEVERLHGCANETILALKAERDAIKAELDTLKERLTYGPAKAFAEIDALKAEVEILHQNTETLKTLQQDEREGLKAEMERQAGLWDEQHTHQHALLAKLEAEVAVARERLGPGGYRILVEVATLRAENARFRKALSDWLKAYDDTGPDNGPSLVEHDCALAARAALAAPQTGDDDAG